MVSSFAGNLEYFLKSLLQQVAACGFWRDSQPAVGLAHAGVGLVLNTTARSATTALGQHLLELVPDVLQLQGTLS